MKKVWELFENLNEYVYASDIDNHEIVYMNKKAREKFGYDSIDDAKRKKCYEIIHGLSEPCENCRPEDLKPNKFLVSQLYDADADTNIILKNTLIEDNGKRIKLEIAISTYEYTRQRNIYQNLEATVNKCLRISLKEPTPDRSLNVLIEYLGKALNGERAFIFEKNSDGTDTNTYEWTAEGIESHKDELQEIPDEIFDYWYKSFMENTNIAIKDVENIREENEAMYKTMKLHKVTSLVIIPLYKSSHVIGLFGISNPPPEHIDYASDMLQIMGHFISASIERRNLVKRLEIMSFTDQLTNFGNRYAMQAFTQTEMSKYDKIGILYCDITGLKKINDRQGHKAGDDYILSACSCLRKVFCGFKLFRIGGDELLILCPDMDEDDLPAKSALLKKTLEKNSVAMAVGAVWKTGSFSIDEALKEAEALMYKDKAEYYKAKGIDRRK